jgi:selenide,water dikinase
MRGLGRPAWTEAALAAMQASPFPAARVLRAHGATACADVTGFGLLNHLAEMLEASGTAASLNPFAVPALPGALEALAAGVASTLHPGNAAAASPRLRGEWTAVPAARRALMLDPQTAGGLLAGIPAAALPACLRALRAAGCGEACVIGRVEPGPPAISLDEISTEPALFRDVETPMQQARGWHAEHHRDRAAGAGKPLPAADR